MWDNHDCSLAANGRPRYVRVAAALLQRPNRSVPSLRSAACVARPDRVSGGLGGLGSRSRAAVEGLLMLLILGPTHSARMQCLRMACGRDGLHSRCDSSSPRVPAMSSRASDLCSLPPLWFCYISIFLEIYFFRERGVTDGNEHAAGARPAVSLSLSVHRELEASVLTLGAPDNMSC